jgi:hypothetical protein
MARYGNVLQLIGCEYDRGLLTIKSQYPDRHLPREVRPHFMAPLEEARSPFHRAIRLNPGDTSEAMAGLSKMKLCPGHHEEALDWAERSPNWQHAH